MYDAYVAMPGNQLKSPELDMSDNAIEKLKSANQELRGEAKELASRVKDSRRISNSTSRR